MAWAPRSLGCNRGGSAVPLHFWLCDPVGPPDHIEPTGGFLNFGSDRLDIRMRLHYATGIQWIGKPSVHPFGWEVRVHVALAEGNISLVMGVSMKGAGHYIWTSGTPLVLERAKDMVFGQGAGVEEVVHISYVLLLLEPRDTG